MVLTAQLLGSFRLLYGETAVSLPSRTTAKTLLAYLLLHHPQPHTRSQLAYLLSPDASEEQARRVLSRALWQIRQCLPVPLLHTQGDHIYILPDAPLHLDVAEFSALVAPHLLSSRLDEAGALALKQAIALCDGELLSEFYDDWLLLRRELLREQYLQALWLLSNWEKENGRFQSALQHLLQLSQADPLREEAHREIMRCYALLNRHNAAMRQYELCRRLLHTELQLEPEPATHQLWQEIRAQREADESVDPNGFGEMGQPPALVGRQRERKAILQQLQNGKQQRGNLILLEGNAGSGKTRLCQAVAQDAAWRTMQVLWSDGSETGQTVPYQALISAVKMALTPLWVAQLRQRIEPVWLPLLALFFPEFGEPEESPLTASRDEALTTQHQQLRLQEAWLRLLAGWSQLTPLFLVLEDAHEMDRATMDLLTLLAHRLHDQRLVLLLSYRGDAARQNEAIWDWLQLLDETAVTQRITLANLSRVETSQFVQSVLGLETAVPQFEQQIFQITGGNPLFILETLNVLQAKNVLQQDEKGNWTTNWDELVLVDRAIDMPSRVELAIAQRIDHLDEDAHLLLVQTAVLDSEFTLDILCAISPLSNARTFIALNHLIHHQFINELPDGYGFSHQMIRQAAYARLEAAERQHAHQRAAHALQQRQPHAVEALAYHHAQAGEIAAAIDSYLQAARHARQQFALATAKLHLDRAIDLLQTMPQSPVIIPHETPYQLFAEREAIAHILGDAESRQHDLNEMHRLAQDSPARLAETERRFAHFYTDAAQPDYELAVHHAQLALQIGQQQNSPTDIAAAYAIWGHARIIQGDIQAALTQLALALSHYQGIAEPAAEAAVLLDQAVGLRMAADHHAALASVQAALALFVAQGDKMAQVNALAELAVLNHEQGNVPEATAYYGQTIQLAREIGYRYREATTLANWGNLLWFQGDFNQTFANYEAASLIFGELGNIHLEAHLRGNMASFLTTPFAQFAEARGHGEWALAQFQKVEDWPGVAQVLATLGVIAQEEEDLAQAYTYLSDSLVASAKVQGTNYLHVMALRQLALVELDRKQPVSALAYAEQALAVCQKSGMADLQVTSGGVRGLALLHLGRVAEALVETETAVSALKESVDQDYLVWWWHYQVLTALGRDAEAAQALQESYALLLNYVSPLTEAQQQHSLAALHEHAEIVATWQAGYQQVTVSLPHAAAPTGRPLRADEFVSVAWSVETVLDTAVADKKQRRQQRLQRLLAEAAAQQAAPTIQDLAAALHVSPGTIKRDLAAMRQAGIVVNTRGS